MVDIVKFAETVQQMRDAQKEFFRTKATVALVKSKKIEKDVDDMVLVLSKPQPVSQSDMFGKPLPLAQADMKHEIKFCLTQELSVNEHGRFVYTSSDGVHSFAVPELLSDFRDFLFKQGITKDYQRA